MAKLRKLPKKPKASASASTIENYFKKVKEVQSVNRKIMAEAAKKITLRKKLSAFRPKAV